MDWQTWLIMTLSPALSLLLLILLGWLARILKVSVKDLKELKWLVTNHIENDHPKK